MYIYTCLLVDITVPTVQGRHSPIGEWMWNASATFQPISGRPLTTGIIRQINCHANKLKWLECSRTRYARAIILLDVDVGSESMNTKQVLALIPYTTPQEFKCSPYVRLLGLPSVQVCHWWYNVPQSLRSMTLVFPLSSKLCPCEYVWGRLLQEVPPTARGTGNKLK